MENRILVNANHTDTLCRNKDSTQFWLERLDTGTHERIIPITKEEAIRWIEQFIWDMDMDGPHMMAEICKYDLGVEPPKWILELIEEETESR